MKKQQQTIASLPRRFGAYLLDWYIGALFTSFPIAIVSQKVYGTMKNQNLLEYPHQLGLICGLFALLGAIIYYVIIPLMVNKGQTIGKRICHIKIVKSDGKDVGLKELLLREVLGAIVIEGVLYSASTILHQVLQIGLGISLVKPMMYVGFVITIVSAILCLVNKKEHLALHDYLARTKVVDFS